MRAAGGDAEGEIDALLQQRRRAGGQRGEVRRMVGHFLPAVIHVNQRVGGDLRLPDDAPHLARAEPQAGGKTDRFAENGIECRRRVQAHQPAHRRTGNQRVVPVRQGAQIRVDHRLETVDEPVHRRTPAPADAAEFRVFTGERAVFLQPIVADGVAFHCRDDQRRLRFVHISGHAPRFAVGRVFVKENVVAVEHIHHREARVRLRVVTGRQIQIGAALEFRHELGDLKLPLVNHVKKPPQNEIRVSFIKVYGTRAALSIRRGSKMYVATGFWQGYTGKRTGVCAYSAHGADVDRTFRADYNEAIGFQTRHRAFFRKVQTGGHHAQYTGLCDLERRSAA